MSTAPTVNPNNFQPITNIEEPTSPSRFKLGCYKQNQCLDPPKRQKHCTSPIIPRQNIYLNDAKRMKTMRPSNYATPILGSVQKSRKASVQSDNKGRNARRNVVTGVMNTSGVEIESPIQQPLSQGKRVS